MWQIKNIKRNPVAVTEVNMNVLFMASAIMKGTKNAPTGNRVGKNMFVCPWWVDISTSQLKPIFEEDAVRKELTFSSLNHLQLHDIGSIQSTAKYQG